MHCLESLLCHFRKKEEPRWHLEGGFKYGWGAKFISSKMLHNPKEQTNWPWTMYLNLLVPIKMVHSSLKTKINMSIFTALRMTILWLLCLFYVMLLHFLFWEGILNPTEQLKVNMVYTSSDSQRGNSLPFLHTITPRKQHMIRNEKRNAAWWYR